MHDIKKKKSRVREESGKDRRGEGKQKRVQVGNPSTATEYNPSPNKLLIQIYMTTLKSSAMINS